MKWRMYEVTHQGTNSRKETKTDIHVHQYELYKMNSIESIAQMFAIFTYIIMILVILVKHIPLLY